MDLLIQKLNNRLALLEHIQSDSKGLWGSMGPQQMIEHVGGIFYATATFREMQPMLPPDQAAKVKSRFFSAYYPFPRNVKAPTEVASPKSLRYTSLEEAHEKLLQAAHSFLDAYKKTPEKTMVHGYFGELDLKEWLIFHTKHLEHHLMQFGVLPMADEKITEIEKLLYKVRTKVSADTPAEWGQMNAHQMIEHLSLVFIFSTGKFNFSYTGTEEDAQRYWKDFQQSDDPWKDVFPTIALSPPRPTREATIEQSKVVLQQTFQKYLAYCEANPDAIHPHLLLGPLTIDQWRMVHVKHLRHHLRQFGVDV